MQVEIKIDSACREPKLVITTNVVTDEIKILLEKLTNDYSPIISGIKDNKVEILAQDSLIRIYANGGKIFADSTNGTYTLHARLYEIENKLNPNNFVRISNAEIINLNKVKCFDFNFSGTICVKFLNGSSSYVSRRFVSKIKRILGL